MEKEYGDVVAVLPVRFQTEDLAPDVHPGHWSMVEEVCKEHHEVHFILGVPQSYPTDNDPLPFEARVSMIGEAIARAFPDVRVTFEESLSRQISYEERSKRFDESLRARFPGRRLIVYGAEDSFIDKYSGNLETRRVATTSVLRGKDLRQRITWRHTRDFRAGYIKSIMDRTALAYPAVDIIVGNRNTGTLILVKKEDEDGWRFPGVLYRPNIDTSYESAAVRALAKELPGITVGSPAILESTMLPDWRYGRSKDKIVTLVMFANYESAIPVPGEGVINAREFGINEFRSHLIKDHEVLGQIAYRRFFG